MARTKAYTPLDFNNFVPYPQKFKDMDEISHRYSVARDNARRKWEEDHDTKPKLVAYLHEHGVKGNLHNRKFLLLKRSRDLWWKLYVVEHGERPKDGFNNGGYEWRCKYWGTKWNAYDVDGSFDGIIATYIFNTAWSFPCPIIIAMSKAFRTLRFELHYEEPGMAFEGDLHCEGGIVVCDNLYDYIPQCENCGEKSRDVEYYEDEDGSHRGNYCPACLAEMKELEKAEIENE